MTLALKGVVVIDILVFKQYLSCSNSYLFRKLRVDVLVRQRPLHPPDRHHDLHQVGGDRTPPCRVVLLL
jgi:hypothetical protein